MARQWYAYNGIGDPLLSSSYNIAPTTPLCVNGWKICAILSPGTSTPAALSVNLRAYIASGQVTGLQQPPPAVDMVRYLFMRPC